MSRSRAIDVAVVGAGPAGCAAALRLRQLGRDVVVFDDVPRAPVGETLPPGVRGLLDLLGVGHLLDGHLPSPGSEAVWGSDEPHHVPFFVHARGPGVHLDRDRFDTALRATLGDAWVRERVRVGDGLTTSTGSWSPRFTIDATGRQRVVGRARGVERVRHDRTVARLWRYAGQSDARTTLVEAVADGWWYAAAVPDGDHVVAYFGDGDAPAMPARVAARIAGAPLAAWSRPAWVETPTAVAGPDWLLTGDAALAADPLSSQGIALALDLGISAAEAVHAALDGDGGAVPRYAEAVRGAQERHLARRRETYAVEQRFADRPFWRWHHGRVDLAPDATVDAPRDLRRGLLLPPSALAALAEGAPGTAHQVVRTFLDRPAAVRTSPAHRTRTAVRALQSLTEPRTRAGSP